MSKIQKGSCRISFLNLDGAGCPLPGKIEFFEGTSKQPQNKYTENNLPREIQSTIKTVEAKKLEAKKLEDIAEAAEGFSAQSKQSKQLVRCPAQLAGIKTQRLTLGRSSSSLRGTSRSDGTETDSGQSFLAFDQSQPEEIQTSKLPSKLLCDQIEVHSSMLHSEIRGDEDHKRTNNLDRSANNASARNLSSSVNSKGAYSKAKTKDVCHDESFLGGYNESLCETEIDPDQSDNIQKEVSTDTIEATPFLVAKDYQDFARQISESVTSINIIDEYDDFRNDEIDYSVDRAEISQPKGNRQIEKKYKNNKKNGNSKNDLIGLFGALPGELITFELHEYRGVKSYKIVHINEHSKMRQVPECQYFGKCGGCKLQHLRNDYYQSFKQQLVNRYSFTHGANLHPIKFAGSASRRKIELNFTSNLKSETEVITDDYRLLLGFYAHNSHTIINIDHCKIAQSDISNLVPILRQYLESIKLPGIGRITILKADNGIELLLRFKKEIPASKLFKNLKQFCDDNNINRFIISSNLLANERCLYRKAVSFIKYGKFQVQVNPNSFVQSASVSDEFLAAKIKILINKYYYKKREAKIIEFFSGHGTLTLPLAEIASIDAYELNCHALNCLKLCANTYNLDIKVHCQNLFDQPVNNQMINNYDIAVLNPPRAGAAAQVQQIAASSVQQIIYVSCNPQTLEIDSAFLKENGYIVTDIYILDQFTYSTHIEVVACFIKQAT